MQEKIQILRKALMDYLITMSVQDPAVLVRNVAVLAVEFSYLMNNIK